MKRNKAGRKLFGIILAVAGTVLVIQTVPLFIWYTLLAVLSLLLAMLILKK